MEASFKTFLKSFGLGDEVCEHISSAGCKSLFLFRSWIPKRKENTTDICEVLLLGSPWEAMDTPDKCAIGAIVRGAYERALEADARACKRSAEGLSPEEGIEPLKKEVDEDLQVLFKAPKIAVPPSSRIGSDVLIAILHGQFMRSVPEFFDIMQTKTRALERSKLTKGRQENNRWHHDQLAR